MPDAHPPVGIRTPSRATSSHSSTARTTPPFKCSRGSSSPSRHASQRPCLSRRGQCVSSRATLAARARGSRWAGQMGHFVRREEPSSRVVSARSGTAGVHAARRTLARRTLASSHVARRAQASIMDSFGVFNKLYCASPTASTPHPPWDGLCDIQGSDQLCDVNTTP